jgi:hypothetical protein
MSGDCTPIGASCKTNEIVPRAPAIDRRPCRVRGTFLPVAERQTGMKGAFNGLREHAPTGADYRIVAADRGGYGER